MINERRGGCATRSATHLLLFTIVVVANAPLATTQVVYKNGQACTPPPSPKALSDRLDLSEAATSELEASINSSRAHAVTRLDEARSSISSALDGMDTALNASITSTSDEVSKAEAEAVRGRDMLAASNATITQLESEISQLSPHVDALFTSILTEIGKVESSRDSADDAVGGVTTRVNSARTALEEYETNASTYVSKAVPSTQTISTSFARLDAAANRTLLQHEEEWARIREGEARVSGKLAEIETESSRIEGKLDNTEVKLAEHNTNITTRAAPYHALRSSSESELFFHIEYSPDTCMSETTASFCPSCTDGMFNVTCMDRWGQQRVFDVCFGAFALLPPLFRGVDFDFTSTATSAQVKVGHGSCCVNEDHLFGCVCDSGYNVSTDCRECMEGHYGFYCDACPCSSKGVCSDGRKGRGECTCEAGWGGRGCHSCQALLTGSSCNTSMSYFIAEKAYVRHPHHNGGLGQGGAKLSDDGNVLVSASNGAPQDEEDMGALHVWVKQEGGSEGTSGGVRYTFLQDLRPLQALTSGDGLGLAGVAISADASTIAAPINAGDKGVGAGAVDVFRRNSSGMYEPYQRLYRTSPSAGDDIGLSTVAVSGDGAVVAGIGAGIDKAGENMGGAVVWELNVTVGTYEEVQVVTAMAVREGAHGGMHGASLSESGTTLVLGDFHRENETGHATGALLVFRRERIYGYLYQPVQVLFAVDGREGDMLGVGGVAMSGDGMVVGGGAPYRNEVGPHSGAAYVWRWNIRSEVYEHAAKLVPFDGEEGDFFGSSVSLNVDGSVIAVASPYRDENDMADIGAVYVWRWDDSSDAYLYVQKLASSQPFDFDRSGHRGTSFSPLGGFFVFASEYDDTGATNAGALWVAQVGVQNQTNARCYHLPVGGGMEGFLPDCACVFPFEGPTCDECRVGYYGDECRPCACNGEMCDDGKQGNGTCLCGEGRYGDTCECVQGHFCFEQRLLDPTGESGDRLGYGGAATSGDGAVIVASSPLDGDTPEAGTLSVWRWNGTSSEYDYLQKLFVVGAEADEQLGSGNVAVSDDGMLISAATHLSNRGGEHTGSVHTWVYNNQSGLFEYSQSLATPSASAGDQLGKGGVSISGDSTTLAAGRPYADMNETDSGSIEVWVRNENTQLYEFYQTLAPTYIPPNATVGYGGVALSYSGLHIVAATFADNDGSLYLINGGMGMVWYRPNTSVEYTYLQIIIPPYGERGDLLGYGGVSISYDGMIIAAGAHSVDGDGVDEGAVYLFIGSDWSQNYVFLQKLVVAAAEAGAQLGYGGAVVSSNRTFVVGAASREDDYGRDSGSVHVWQKKITSETYAYDEELHSPFTDSNDLLGDSGASLSGDGDTLVATTWKDSDDEPERGAIHVWKRKK